MLLLSILFSCRPKEQDTSGSFYQFPSPSEMLPLRGTGAPKVSFTEEQLFQNCAILEGGEQDALHHNLVVPYRGHLVMPWVPEWGRGGLSFFDMEDPCNPEKVGEGFHERMRESHAIGFATLSEEEEWAVTTGTLGIQFWDINDVSSPEMINYLQIEGIFYPDSYARVVLSVFWQYPWVYVAGADNGIYVVDATDPANAEVVTHYEFENPLRTAGVFAIGNQLLVTAAEGSGAEVLDISDPVNPQPIGGGRFEAIDGNGEPKEAYHGNLVGDYALFARKEGGGGIIVMDISNPSNPTYVGDVHTEAGNGGYAYLHENYGFLGDSHWGKVFDMSDMSNIQEIGTGYLEGDLDTLTPFGNIAILSVDEDAVNDEASAVMPWMSEPDTNPPTLVRTVPADGEENVAITSRIGLGFNEFIEPSSVFAGSIQLFDQDGNAVEGWGSAQEATGNYTPKEPLLAGTTYTLKVMADGVEDISGNKLGETQTITFKTAGVR